MPGDKSKNVHPARDQFGYPDESNSIDHGRSESPKGKSASPSASGFKAPEPLIGQNFKDRGSVNPMGQKKGNPSGFPGL